MSLHKAIVALLLGVAVVLTGLCAVGVLVMRDPYQRLHYVSPPGTLGAILITIAVFLDEERKQAGLKMLLITGVLVAVNGVITHATARAVRIRDLGRLSVGPDERIPVVGREGFLGQGEEPRDGGRT